MTNRTDSRSGSGFRSGGWLVALLMIVSAASASAQTLQNEMVPRPPQSPSPFNLQALGQAAMTGMNNSGLWGPCFTNMGLAAPRDILCGNTYINASSTPAENGNLWTFAEIPFYIGAPPSDVPEAVVDDSLIGGGFTVNRTSGLPVFRKLYPSDRSGAELLATSVLTSNTGDCRDYRDNQSGRVASGFQILPLLGCPQTWPDPNFSGGARRIDAEGWEQFQLLPKSNDGPFAFWSVPGFLHTDEILGTEQTYGEFADWTVDLLTEYASVVPGGTDGTSQLRGWPMGITVYFNAFYFNTPSLNNTYFWRATIVNNSYKVYGDREDPATGADYDSLYAGLQPLTLFGASQQFTMHFDPVRNTVFVNHCSQRAVINGAQDTPTQDTADCPDDHGLSGFNTGALAFTFLRTPLGDVRNKLLTNPEATAFYRPGHPAADDTINMNQMQGCGFSGQCHVPVIVASDRSYFGLISGTIDNVLNGRPASDFGDSYWNIVHNADWPNRGPYNNWVPTGWDYDEDGEQDNARIYTCLGVGPDGCADLWSDTLPGGFVNTARQFPNVGVGPFALASGDTTSFFIALTWEPDSALIERAVNTILDTYKNFFLLPKAAPPPTVAAAPVTTSITDDAEITLVFDGLEDYRDVFVANVVATIENAVQGSRFGNMKLLNPWLLDSLRARVTNNLTDLYIFKSCDGADSFTNDDDCAGDAVPAGDGTSKWSNFGWLPYATLEPDVGSYTDSEVQPGLRHFYSIVTEKQGAVFDVRTGATIVQQANGTWSCTSECAVETVTFAPPILSPLKTTAGGSAVNVYVPLSRSAGYAPASARLQLPENRIIVPVNVTVTDSAVTGSYAGTFADSAVITQVTNLVEGDPISFSTTATLFDIASVYDPVSDASAPGVLSSREFTGPTDFGLAGATTVDTESQLEDDTVTVVTRTAVFDDFMLLLSRQGSPLAATATFGEGTTTPGELVSSSDFPGFVLDVIADSAETFRGSFVVTASGDTLPDDFLASDGVAWRNSEAENQAGYYSEYRITWNAHPFGPLREFDATLGNVDDRFLQSLEDRADENVSVTGDEAVDALAAAGIDVSTLNEYSLPFEIVNTTTGQTVDVAVLSHGDEIRLGDPPDTVRIDLPTDVWLPGDEIALIETLTRDSTVSGGVVLAGNGDPIQVTRRFATWSGVIGCTPDDPTVQCNPVVAGDYLSVEPGTEETFTYVSKLDSDVAFGIDVVAPSKATGPGDRVVDLSQVRVVPNPYIVFSRFEMEDDQNIIKFTNLPPSGTITIFTVSGQLLQRLTYEEDDLVGSSGDLVWDMRTMENTAIAYGLYIFVLESEFGTKAGKFVVIR